MDMVLKGLKIYGAGGFRQGEISISGGKVSFGAESVGGTVFSFDNAYVFPGFTDVHVHLREPGFCYKETIKTGTEASARGGYTTVCSMPNLKPVPDSLENLKVQTDIIEKDAVIEVVPYGAITVGQKGETLADMEAMAPFVCGFTDDGRGVQSDEMILSAMKKAASLGKMIVAHCEDESLLGDICVHNGAFAEKHGFSGCGGDSEYKQVERDIELVEKVGCAYHVCHVSSKDTVEVIRKAKARGVNITCETGPHYLAMNDSMIENKGRFKMNPPIRSEEDRLGLIEGILDGTVDMIATDHAPHSFDEKKGDFTNSLNGVVGIETAFPVLYTHLVKTGIITLEKLIELMYENPKKRFGLGRPMEEMSFTVYDLDDEYEINPKDFKSMGKFSPFEGQKVFGRCLMTVYKGKIVWIDPKLTEVN